MSQGRACGTRTSKSCAPTRPWPSPDLPTPARRNPSRAAAEAADRGTGLDPDHRRRCPSACHASASTKRRSSVGTAEVTRSCSALASSIKERRPDSRRVIGGGHARRSAPGSYLATAARHGLGALEASPARNPRDSATRHRAPFRSVSASFSSRVDSSRVRGISQTLPLAATLRNQPVSAGEKGSRSVPDWSR